MPGENLSVRESLLRRLRGQTLHIPNLENLFAEWPQYQNPHLPDLEKVVAQHIESLFPPGKRLGKMRAANAALFGSLWWPYASFETLRIATLLSIWLFAWDDETDSAEFSSLVHEFDKACAFRSQTLDYAKWCLSHDQTTFSSQTPKSNVIRSFSSVGNAIYESCTSEQISRFVKELENYIAMTEVEQEVQLTGEMPTIEEYRVRRMGSGAVGVCLAITEYCFDMELPSNVMGSQDMKQIWEATNVIISTVNDILSIRKEVMQDQVDSLLPVLYLEYEHLDLAMEEANKTLHEFTKIFETSAERLLRQFTKDADLFERVRKFIHGCQCACTGNLRWSLESGRYLLGHHDLADGIDVIL